MLEPLELDFEMKQGSPEWLSLRKTKITATDASVILGVNPWKTEEQLFDEKLSLVEDKPPNAAMQRGIDLEPMARELFSIKVRTEVRPVIAVRDWAMASLDGIPDFKTWALEIKCPGKKDHEKAVRGEIPDYYYPQLQHQMYVLDIDGMFYFSFDGIDGVIVQMQRDDHFIKQMVEKEIEFYKRFIHLQG